MAENQEKNGPPQINLFWVELAHITSHFASDVEQIRFVVENTQVPMPSDYKRFDGDPPQQFFEAKEALRYKQPTDTISVPNGDGENFTISKEMIDSVFNILENQKLKDKRNENFLNIVAFNHLVSLFDAAMVDFAEALHKKYPFAAVPIEKGASIPSLNYIDILNAPSVESLKTEIRQRELLQFGYSSVKDQITFFNKILNRSIWYQAKNHVSINLDEELFGSLIEIRETRNIHVHNRGIVNEIYVNKVRQHLNDVNKNIKKPEDKIQSYNYMYNMGQLGRFREIDKYYLSDAINKLTNILYQIKQALIEKFISDEEKERIEKDEAEYWSRQRVAKQVSQQVESSTLTQSKDNSGTVKDLSD